MDNQLTRQPAHLLSIARDLAIVILIVTATCCASSGGFNEQAQAAGAPALTATVLAQLDALPAPAGSDSRQFACLKQRLANELARQLVQGDGIPAPSSCQVSNVTAYRTTDGMARITWTYNSQGDYDQNSEVSVQDLSTLALHYGQSQQSPTWHFNRVADGDNNGEINACDITPIAQFLGTRVENYIIETSADGASGWSESAKLSFGGSTLHDLGGFRRFSIETQAQPGSFWRVVPHGSEERGMPSPVVEYTGDQAPVRCVSGKVFDSQHVPVPGLQVELTGSNPLVTESDGSYCFDGLQDGTTAFVSVVADARVIIPAQRAVVVDGEDEEELNFSAFTVATLHTELPAQVYSGDVFSFTLRALDAAGQPLAGFNTSASLTSEPAGVQLTSPLRFLDGTAQVRASFPSAGDYLVSITGLNPAVDGVIGSVQVSEVASPEASVAVWRHDATAAISLTFDDGTADHWQRGMALWDDYGFKVTLGIISSLFPQERIPQLAEAHAAGHELANHSSTHPDLSTLSTQDVRMELSACRSFLLHSVPGLEYVPTVIYPYENFNDTVMNVLQDEGYLFARSGYQGIVEYAELNDVWNPPLLHLYSWANLNTLPVSMWNDTTDWAVSQGGWLVEQCHGIGAEGEPGVGWNPRPETEYREHYDHIATYGDSIWVAPVGEVGTYLIERNCATLKIISAQGGSLDFTVATSLELPSETVPLTVRLTKPEGWSNLYARQGGTLLPVEEYSRADVQYFRFDVIPDGSIVSVTRK